VLLFCIAWTSIRSVGAGRVSPVFCKRLVLSSVNGDLAGRASYAWVVDEIAESGPDVAASPPRQNEAFLSVIE